MNKYLSISLVLSLITMIFSYRLNAQRQRPTGNKPGVENRGNNVLQFPGLTEYQKEQIKNLLEKHRNEMVDFRKENPKPKTRKERKVLDKKLKELKAKHLTELKSLLNEEQQKFLEQITNRSGNQQGKGSGRGGNRGRPGGF